MNPKLNRKLEDLCINTIRILSADEGSVIGVDRFGASAPGQEIVAHLGFTAEHIAAAALHLLGKNNEADQEGTR